MGFGIRLEGIKKDEGEFGERNRGKEASYKVPTNIERELREKER